MFSKAGSASGSAQRSLRGKDARALHTRAAAEWGTPGVDFSGMLPEGCMTESKLHLPDKSLTDARAYACSDGKLMRCLLSCLHSVDAASAIRAPLLLSISRSRDAASASGMREHLLFPSLLLLWLHPPLSRMLPTLVIPSPASQYILHGADLMWPGVLNAWLDGENTRPSLPRLCAGDVALICVEGNPAPLALCEMLISSEEARSRAGRGGLTGKAARVLHVLGDDLWVAAGRPLPNAACTPMRVYALDEGAGEWAEGPAAGEAAAADGVVCEDGAAPGDAGVDPASVEREAASTAYRNLFLAALHRVTPADLPLPCARLCGVLMPACVAGGPYPCVPQVKSTTWKKAAVFLREAEADGIIVLAQTSADEDVHIVSVNRKHAAVKEFTPWEVVADATPAEDDDDDAAPLWPADVTYQSLVRPYPCTHAVLRCVGVTGVEGHPTLLTATVAKRALPTYVASHGLACEDAPARMVFDAALADALSGPKDHDSHADDGCTHTATQKYSSRDGGSVTREDAAAMWETRMQAWHVLSFASTGESVASRGPVPTLSLTVKHVHGGGSGVCTLITGCGHYRMDPSRVARRISKLLSVAATVSVADTAPRAILDDKRPRTHDFYASLSVERPDAVVVSVAGDQRDRIADVLAAAGVPPELIANSATASSKGGKKKKK